MKHTSIDDLLSDGPPSDNGDDSTEPLDLLSDSALAELLEEIDAEGHIEIPELHMEPFNLRVIDKDSLLELIEWPFSLGYTLEDFLIENVDNYNDPSPAFEFALLDHDAVNEAFDVAVHFHADLEACWSRFNKWCQNNRNVYINMA